MAADPIGPSAYELIGGEEAIRRLAAAFYARVERDSLLRPLYPRHLTCAKEALSSFLVQFFGGPPLYSQSWRLSLREAHARFAIGPAERDAWLRNMTAAIDELAIAEPARSAMLHHFAEASAFLINRPGSLPAGSSSAPPVDSLATCPVRQELAWRWAALRVYEELVAACQAGDAARATTLVEDPLIRMLVDRDPTVIAPVVAAMGTGGSDALLADAGAWLQAEPMLAAARFGSGGTLLHAAAGTWSSRFTAMLLEAGADANAVDGAGHTPLYYAGNRLIERGTPNAGSGGDVVRLLIAAGADPNACGGVKSCTPLHMAARRGNVGIAEALLDGGADIEARDSQGETALRRAVNCGQPEMAAFLLARGADADSTCRRGKTPAQATRGAAMQEVFRQRREHRSSLEAAHVASMCH